MRLLIVCGIASVSVQGLVGGDSEPPFPGSKQSQAAKPNVVILIADQWRASAFGFSGDPNVKTPHLDRLARASFRFINAVAGLPVCCPTRASLLTGQRPLTTGVFMNDVSLASDAVTLAKVLREAGYDTGYIGKWHLNGDGRSNFIPRERRQGFDYWKALECTHHYNHSYYYADGPEKLVWNGYDAIAETQDAEQYVRDHGPGSMARSVWSAPYSGAFAFAPCGTVNSAGIQRSKRFARFGCDCGALDKIDKSLSFSR